MIRERLSLVHDRIEAAALRAGRAPEDITLIAVSKVKPAADIQEAYAAGQRHFGESYIQEFQNKRRDLTDLPGAIFHLIGKLQSNKTAPASRLFDVIQTVHSQKVARRLNESGKALDVFIEIKLSDEESKSGAVTEDLAGLKSYIESCENLKLRGLMTIPPWSDDPQAARPYFRRLRELAEQHQLAELSMGMSHDMEVAIEEGATIVRVGTAIFGKRVRPQ